MNLTKEQSQHLADNNFGGTHTDEDIKAELISAGLLTDSLAKSSGIDGDAGDWTQTEGAGLTDNTTSLTSGSITSVANTSFVKPTLHVEGAS